MKIIERKGAWDWLRARADEPVDYMLHAIVVDGEKACRVAVRCKDEAAADLVTDEMMLERARQHWGASNEDCE